MPYSRLASVIALFTVIGVVGFVAPSSAAPHRAPPKTTVKHLRARLRTLHTQVRILTAERNALQATLAAATSPRTKANGHRIPTPLAVAVGQVRREVQWAQGSTTAPLRGQFVAEAAMDYVVGHVSTGVYGYLELVYGETPGGPDLPPYYAPVNTILASQTGICVQAERTFEAIVKKLGFRVRDVGFDYVNPDGTPGAHSAAEVRYDGSWHFFDPTFGQFWTNATGNVLSINDVRTVGGIEHRDNAAFTNLIEDAEVPAGVDTWFETQPSTTVVFVERQS